MESVFKSGIISDALIIEGPELIWGTRGLSDSDVFVSCSYFAFLPSDANEDDLGDALRFILRGKDFARKFMCRRREVSQVAAIPPINCWRVIFLGRREEEAQVQGEARVQGGSSEGQAS